MGEIQSAIRKSQALVVRRLDNHDYPPDRLNRYPVDSVVCFANNYPLDSDLSDG